MGQFSKFCLCQQLFAFKEFHMETRLRNILKTPNVTELIKTILKRSHKVLLDTCNLVALSGSVFLSRAIEF